eukprot:717145_1
MVNVASMLPRAASEVIDPEEYIPMIMMSSIPITPLIRTITREEADSAIKGEPTVRFAIAKEGNHAYVTQQHAREDKHLAMTLKHGEMPQLPVISSIRGTGTGTGTGERPRDAGARESGETVVGQPKFVISSPMGETTGKSLAHEEYDNDYYSQSNHMVDYDYNDASSM